ncbi:MAG: penicillin-binding protein activator [Candidatus Latescibacter sp.]|nr:penicillin-binding protein activator [Candidatus Latescibacter sp.]
MSKRKLFILAFGTVSLSLFFLWTEMILAQTNDAEALFKHGIALYKQGKFVAARLDFREILDIYKNSPRETSAYVMLAKTYYNLGAYTEADSLAVRLRTVFPHSRYREWTFYMEAACKLRKGDSKNALELLASLAGTTKDRILRDHSLKALRYSVKPLVDNESFNAALAAHHIGINDLESLSPGKGIPSPLLAAVEEPSTESTGKPARKAWENSSSLKIGCICPLTGPHAETGMQLLKGVKAGLALRDSFGGRKVELIVEDTESDAVTSVLKVRKLVLDGVIAIIGPVYSAANIPAAVESNDSGIPFIAPTATDTGLTRIGKYVFQLNLTAAVQAEKIAAFTVTTLGLTTTVVVASKDNWGEEAARSFTREMEKLKGKVVWTAFFNPESESEDISRLIQEIRDHAPKAETFADTVKISESNVALPDTSGKDSSIYSSQKLLPVDTIQAIFISATMPDAIKIASRIMEYNINAVLLGDSGWNDPTLPEEGKQYVEGAYLVAPVGELSGGTGTSFLKGDTFRDERDVIAMKGYDAGAVISDILSRGARDPEALLKAMETVKSFQGSSSLITIDPVRHTNIAVEFTHIQNGIYTRAPQVKRGQ